MKLNNKWELLRALWSNRLDRATPAFITLDVTPHCNLTCIGCRFHSPILKNHIAGDAYGSDMPMAVVQRLVQDFALPSTTHIFIEGSGEPFMHPHIIDILTLLKKAQFKLTIFTNGTLVNKEIALKLVKLQVDTIRFSLFAASEATFARNYAGTDVKHFQRIQDNIQQLGELRLGMAATKPFMRLFFAVNRNNRHELYHAMDLAERTGCDAITFGRFVELGEEVAGLGLSKPERMRLARQMRTFLTELHKRSLADTIERDIIMQESGVETWLLAPCLIGWFHVRIRSNGDVVPCCRCSYPLGNLYQQTFAEIWRGAKMNEFRQRAAAANGTEWLKEQKAQCHDCPHIPEIIKLYRVQRMVKWMHNLFDTTIKTSRQSDR